MIATSYRRPDSSNWRWLAFVVEIDALSRRGRVCGSPVGLASLRKSLMSSLVLVHLVAKPKNFNIKYNYAYLDLLSISSFLTVFFIFGYKNLPMSFLSLFRNPGTLGVLNTTTLLAPCGSTYLLRSHMVELSEDHEARMVWLSPHFKALLIMYALYQNKWKYPLRV